MNGIRTACVAAAMGLAWGAAGAAGATSRAFDQCVDKTGGVTASMRDCAHDEGLRQDREMNALYKQAMQRLDPAGRLKLRREQQAYKRHVDKTCAVAVQPDAEGTAGLLEADGCALKAEDRRIEQLRGLAK